MPAFEAPSVELGSAPQISSIGPSPSPSEISSASSPEPPNIRVTPLFRALAMPPPEPAQPEGQDELERRLPGYRRIVIPRDLTLIELLKQSSGVTTDDEVLRIREAKLRVVADRVGLRRLHVLSPRLRNLTLDGSALSSLRDLGIGLVHLKILSINRCGLTSLDGLYGLGALRELYAAENRIHDLQPLAALQKLHSLDLANNPISDSGRLWTLGVCSSLRRLTMTGTPAADDVDYRSRVANALPMLVYLDERPLHNDIEYDSDGILDGGLSSDSEPETEPDLLPKVTNPAPIEPEPGPSTSQHYTLGQHCGGDNVNSECVSSRKRIIRRPATTENSGVRPARPILPLRPKTAHDRRGDNDDQRTRLEILHTLMDDDWLGSGSKLTSVDPVCGNFARALRRTTSAYHRRSRVVADAERELVEQTMEDAARAMAAEIPRAPKLEDWLKFKEETGIEVDIDFNNRPKCPDPSKILERLEQIEKETQERFKEETAKAKGRSNNTDAGPSSSSYLPNSAFNTMSTMNDFAMFPTDVEFSTNTDIATFFDEVNGLHSVSTERISLRDNDDPLTE